MWVIRVFQQMSVPPLSHQMRTWCTSSSRDLAGLATVEPVSTDFEPSLYCPNTDIENWRPETRARNSPAVAENRKNCALETLRCVVKPREYREYSCNQDMPHRDGTGREDSNSRIQRYAGAPCARARCNGGRTAPHIHCRNDWTSAANRASVSSVDVFLPRLGSRPAGDTATVGLRW